MNFSFAIFEFVGGIFTKSVAIISDSIHDISDALSIGISYFLEKKSKKVPDEKYSYGYLRYSVLGSLITTVILLIGSGLIIYNAIKRIINPTNINYNGMIILAIIGVIINFLATYFTREGHSLNQKSVNLHMLEDVLGWVVVLIGAVIMKFTDIKLIDPILSILVALFIFINAFKNLKLIIGLFLIKTPDGICINNIRESLLKIKNVHDVHHIHVWSIDGFNNYATMHIVASGNLENLKKSIKKELEHQGISHVTLEFESIKEECDDKCCQVRENHMCHHHHH